MNMTQRTDGKWRSLASQLGSYGESAKQTPDGFLEAVRHHKKYYGAIFRAEVAFELKQLGYAIEKGEHGFFEIAGISQNTIKAYSQRRKDIEAFLQENQFTGAKAAAVATLKTRPSKKHINRDTLMASWQAKAALFSASALDEIKQVTQQALPSQTLSEHTVKANHPLAHPDHQRHPLAEQAVNDAIAHLSETRIALREAEIVHQASRYVSGDVSIVSLLDTVETLKKTGELIVLPQEADYRGEAYFTTPALLGYEKRLLQAIAKLCVLACQSRRLSTSCWHRCRT